MNSARLHQDNQTHSPHLDSGNTNNTSEASSPQSEVIASARSSRVRVRFRGQFKSLYMEDFKKKTPISNKCYNANIKSVKIQSPTITLMSTHQNDFVNHGIIKTSSCKHEDEKNIGLFMGKSSYQTNFINWQCSNPRMDKMPIQKIVNLPFIGTSSYKNAFIPMDLTCKSHKFPQNRPHVDSQFNYESTSQIAYIQHNVERRKSCLQEDETEKKVFSYPGQFMSESRRSYSLRAFKPAESAKRNDHVIF